MNKKTTGSVSSEVGWECIGKEERFVKRFVQQETGRRAKCTKNTQYRWKTDLEKWGK